MIIFSFIFYYLIQCLASQWMNFSSVVASEIYWHRLSNPDHIIYKLATELNKPKNILYVYFKALGKAILLPGAMI